MTTANFDKTIIILDELRSGKYYPKSNIRKYCLQNLKNSITLLNQEEIIHYKNKIISLIPTLIKNRDEAKISYLLLSDIIISASIGDNLVYAAYEKEIYRLLEKNREKYFFHFITLAQTKNKIDHNISDIEDLFINKYLTVSKRFNSMNSRYLFDFSANVENVDKRKMLVHLFKSKPFRNDNIIIKYIIANEDLNKYATLI